MSCKNLRRLTPAMAVDGAVDPGKGGNCHVHTDGHNTNTEGGVSGNDEKRAGLAFGFFLTAASYLNRSLYLR